jgi:hypothetical protein
MKFQIENYESMTPEEKIAALEAYEPDMSGFVAKATFDKTASELAAAKKTIREKMTEDEVKKAQEAEERATLIERAEKAEYALAVSGYEKAYLAMGYDEKLARSSAEALAKGDTETVFKNQKIHADTREKALRTEMLKTTPSPAPGKADGGMTKEQISKMTLLEKQKFATENPEQYKEIYGGN